MNLDSFWTLKTDFYKSARVFIQFFLYRFSRGRQKVVEIREVTKKVLQ